MKRISKWDIVDDTHKNIDDTQKYLLVSSTNKKSVYGYPINLKTRKITFTPLKSERHEEFEILGNLNFCEMCIDIIEKNPQ